MLKRFFISTLGTITGLWIFSALSLITILVAAVALGGRDAKLPKNGILYLDLSGEVADYPADPQLMSVIEGSESAAPTFSDMLRALERAAGDKKIKGVYLYCGGSEMGVAQREELHRALLKFRKQSGKKVIAYADNYSQGDYLVASAADEIHLNPVGSVDIHGIGTTIPFFTGLFDKLGVKVQVVKVGSFKSAVEPYILHSISDSARLQTVQFIDTIWQTYTQTIADARKLSPAVINTCADSLSATWPTDAVYNNKLVTALSYRRDVEDDLRQLAGLRNDDDLPLVTPAEYLAQTDSKFSVGDDDHVAVLYASGDIIDGYSSTNIAGDTYADQIIALADDDNVKGLVLRVNSGGGSAFASEQIWEALEYFKSTGKPFNVSMGDYAASGGYYISCGADQIWADRSTLTGSIGVFGLIPDFSGLITDKIGIEFSRVASGPNGNFPALTEAMTPQQMAATQRSVENIYGTFLARVAKGRELPEAKVRLIAEGRVWVGSRALELGLVDYIGGLDEAIKATTEACKLDADDYVVLPNNNPQLWKVMLSGTLRDAAAQTVQPDRALQQLAQIYGLAGEELRLVTDLRTRNPIQARMETIIIK